MAKRLLDPLTVAKLENLHIKAKHVVEGIISGLHQSKYSGHSLEFIQHREYSYGDELRHIDWKVYGRLDRFFIKQYHEDTNLRSYILLDNSGSMSFASKGCISKFEYSKILAAVISYLLIKQGDSAGIVVFSDRISNFLPTKSYKSHLSLIIELLEKLTYGGDTKIWTALNDFAKLLKKRSLIILISDLFDEPNKVIQVLKSLASRKHEILVFQVVDPIEEEFDFDGPLIFEFLEPPYEKIYTEAETIKNKYRALFKKFVEEYKSNLQSANITYSFVRTDTPFENVLSCLFR